MSDQEIRMNFELTGDPVGAGVESYGSTAETVRDIQSAPSLQASAAEVPATPEQGSLTDEQRRAYGAWIEHFRREAA